MKEDFGRLLELMFSLESAHNLNHMGVNSVALLGIWEELRKFDKKNVSPLDSPNLDYAYYDEERIKTDKISRIGDYYDKQRIKPDKISRIGDYYDKQRIKTDKISSYFSNLEYSKKSQERLYSCHVALQDIFNEVLNYEILDITIVEGTRSEEDQNRYFKEGKSKVKWPDGKHNTIPSLAVDAVPYINNEPSWNKLHCCVLAGIVLGCAKKRGITVRWGGNWDMDQEPITDQDFQDLAHYELVGV